MEVEVLQLNFVGVAAEPKNRAHIQHNAASI
jgi:hypothetical protein